MKEIWRENKEVRRLEGNEAISAWPLFALSAEKKKLASLLNYSSK